MKKRFRIWKEWQKYCKNGRLYKLAVLFGLIKSPTFGLYYKYEDPFMMGFAMGIRRQDEEQYEAFKINFLDPVAQQYFDQVIEERRKSI